MLIRSAVKGDTSSLIDDDEGDYSMLTSSPYAVNITLALVLS